MTKINQNSQKGFTLLELILYVAILTLMLGTLIPLAWNVVGSSAKSSFQEEVSSQARYVSERIKYEIRNSTGINSLTATSISLATSTGAANPTIIDLSAGKIRITQGTASPVNLNSTDSTVTALVFTSYTSADNKTKNIQYNFTIAGNSTSSRQTYKLSIPVEADAEVRNN